MTAQSEGQENRGDRQKVEMNVKRSWRSMKRAGSDRMEMGVGACA